MEIKVNDKNGVTVVEISGSLDTNTAREAEGLVNNIVDSDKDKLLIDLGETTFVSSAGLRVFLAASKKMNAQGKSLFFCSPNEVVQEVFDISGFSSILNISPSRNEAMDKLNN